MAQKLEQLASKPGASVLSGEEDEQFMSDQVDVSKALSPVRYGFCRGDFNLST